jgi:pimeloyl-ACP methyl ester carboxylesterase
MPEQWTRAERQYVVNGLGVHVAGWEQPRSAEPPLVLLHGLWESWHTFAAFAPRLAERRSVYAIDLRGHGESDKPTSAYGLEDYAADVVAVLEQLGRQPVHLLGHSLGSLVALQVAWQAPQQLARLILEDPPLVDERQWATIRAGLEPVLILKQRPFDVVAAALAEQFPMVAQEWIETEARDLIATADGPFPAMITFEWSTDAWSALLARITLPTLVLAADPAHGGLFGDKQRALIRSAAPTTQVVDFPGCGHDIHVHCPEIFLARVEAFLAGEAPTEDAS